LSDNNLNKEKYNYFHTIDWLKDITKDRFRHNWIQKEKRRGNFIDKLQAWHDACSGWFLVLLVGLGAGIVAGFVDIASGFMSSLKVGICSKAFWLGREQCCWDSDDIKYDDYKNVLCDAV
jgi:chloride channel 3/4/5